MTTFNSLAFGSAYDGGVDTLVGGGGAFNSLAFGSGFYGGADTLTGTTLSTADINAIVAAIFAQAVLTPIKAEIKAINGVTLAGSGTTLDPMRPV